MAAKSHTHTEELYKKKKKTVIQLWKIWVHEFAVYELLATEDTQINFIQKWQN